LAQNTGNPFAPYFLSHSEAFIEAFVVIIIVPGASESDKLPSLLTLIVMASPQ
jgi:hypothetical protein